MEREIKQYEHNVKKLEYLKGKTASTNRLFYLEERILCVKNAYNRLNENEKKIYDLIFKSSCNWLYCQTMYNIDKDTYYNVFNKSVYFLAEEFGEI